MLNSILNAVYSAAVLERGLLHHSYIDDPHRSSDHKGPPCEEHIPPNLVVNRWACDGESGSHRDILCRHGVWTMVRRHISWKIT